ncbi:hypothetical protein B9Z55_005597 [Caenorhabditis nigoni]|uniref:Uncharacterized protein n=1 Tax=Caenorhabditis nigoni TaxID=1611254 RepID=A0A2G5V1L1_9PELO|nr:hypothetical protein B9Z55_005597 [Caenorhabditis nigoni]
MSRVLFVFIEICLGVLQDPAVMIQSMGDQKFGTDRIVCFTERESNESRKKVGETASREQETFEKYGLLAWGNGKRRRRKGRRRRSKEVVVVVGMSHGERA